MLHFPRINSLEQKYSHLVYDEPDRKPLQQVLRNLNISGITPNPKFMGFALMGAMPSMIMRCLGGPL